MGITEVSGAAGEVWLWPVRCSSPERAILEALDELPGSASFEHLDRIFEGLVSLRPEPLMTLLAACRSVKVRRLFFVFADRHGHSWRKYLDAERVAFGSGTAGACRRRDVFTPRTTSLYRPIWSPPRLEPEDGRMLERVASRCPGGFRARRAMPVGDRRSVPACDEGQRADDERRLTVESVAVIHASLRGR